MPVSMLKSSTPSGYTITTGAKGSAIDFNIGVSYLLQEDLVLRFFASRMSTTQDAVYSGSVTGSMEVNVQVIRPLVRLMPAVTSTNRPTLLRASTRVL